MTKYNSAVNVNKNTILSNILPFIVYRNVKLQSTLYIVTYLGQSILGDYKEI
jgi:hypothetical protein